jgi:hypothetical protein
MMLIAMIWQQCPRGLSNGKTASKKGRGRRGVVDCEVSRDWRYQPPLAELSFRGNDNESLFLCILRYIVFFILPVVSLFPGKAQQFTEQQEQANEQDDEGPIKAASRAGTDASSRIQFILELNSGNIKQTRNSMKQQTTQEK